MRRTYAILAALILLITGALAAPAGGDELSLEFTNDIPQSVEAGDRIEFSGRAEGSELQEISIRKRFGGAGGGWLTFGEGNPKDCDGSSECAIQVDYQTDASEAGQTLSFAVGAESFEASEFSDHRSVEVRAEDEEKCNVAAGGLAVKQTILDQGESTTASINVNNYGDSQRVRATFEFDGEELDTDTTEVLDEKTFSTSISPEKSGKLTAVVKTLGEPCGDLTVTEKSEQITVTGTNTAQLNADVLEDGKPVSNARVQAGLLIQETDSDGEATLELDPGEYNIVASKSGFESDSEEVELSPNEIEDITLRLKEIEQQNSRLTVFTEDQDGDELDDVDVRVENGDEINKNTGSDGEVTFSNLEPDDYTVTGDKTGYIDDSRNIELGPGDNRRTTLTLEERDFELTLDVENERGLPIEDAEVDVDGETRFTGGSGRTTFTLEAGRYDYTVSKGNELTTESGSVNLDRDKTEEVTLERIAETPVARLQVSPPEVRVGETITLSGTGSEGAETYRFDFTNDGAIDETNRDGTARFAPKREGSFTAELEVEGDGGSDRDTARYTVLPREGDEGVCNVGVGFLRTQPTTVERGESATARINVYSYGSEQEARVTFEYRGQEVDTVTKNVEEQRRFSTSFTPEDSGRIDAIVDTVGEPCGDRFIEERSEQLTVTGVNRATVNVDVLDQNRDPVRDARVVAGTFRSQTDSNGEATLELGQGDYTVTASKSGFESDSKQISLNPRETRDVTLRLTDEETEEEADLTVLTEELDGDELNDVELIVENGDIRTGNTGLDGQATFTGLKPGEYEIRGEKPGFEPDSRSIELDADEERTTTLTLQKEKPEDASLQVNVEDEDGDEVGDALVEVENGDDEKERTGEYGEAYFTLDPDDYEITVSAEGFESDSRRVSLDEGETRDITLKLREEDASLKVDTEDDDGDELEFVDVTVENGDDITRNTGSDGTVRFRNLEPDRYEVTAERSGYRDESATVRLDPGDDEEITIHLQREDEEASLQVNVEDEDGDEIEDALVEVENGDDERERTDDEGETDFDLEPDEYDVTVSADGFRTETDEVDLSPGEDEELDFELERSDDATLEVDVEDEDGRNLEDVRVRVENGDRDTEFTDFRGIARFDLESDRYDITVSDSDYETERRSVFLSEGEFEREDFTLSERDSRRSVRIEGIGYVSSVCRNNELDVSVTVKNNENYRQSVDIDVSGLGGSDSSTVSLEDGERATRTLTIDNVRGSGSSSFRITVSNGDSQSTTRTVRVQNCGDGVQDPELPEQEPTNVGLNIEPNQLTVGQSFRALGYVDGVNGRTNVEIRLDGSRVTDVQTQPDGFYETYITPQQIGNLNVRAVAGDRDAVQQIDVSPSVSVTSMDAPERAFEAEQFEICTNVESQVAPQVRLLENGESIQTKNQNGEVCFDVETSEGEKEYTVRALAYENTDEMTREVNVLEQDNQVENFPDQVATVRSGDGIVRVSLYNTGTDERRYELNMEGIPEDWFSQTSKSVILTKGERRDVYFYVTPEAEGEFDADISVNSESGRIYQQTVSISSGGTTDSNPDSGGILGNVRGFF